VQLSVGVSHVCAVTSRGAVVCWGDNGVGQSGVGMGRQAPPDHFERPHTVAWLPPIRQVSAGALHTCAVDLDGGLFCWGSLGQGVVVTRGGVTGSTLLHGSDLGTPVRVAFDGEEAVAGVRQVSVDSIANFGCAVLEASVRCWSTFATVPVQAKKGMVRVAASTIALAGVRSVTAVSGKVCAVAGERGSRRLYCWRQGDTVPTAVPWASGAGEPESIAIGPMYACVLDAAGLVRCWHSLVDAFWKRRPDRALSWPGKAPTHAVAVGDSPICTVDTRGVVDCFLSDEGGLTDDAKNRSWATTGLGPHPVDGVVAATDIGLGAGRDAFGYGYGCALRGVPAGEEPQVFCWGDNELGQLGTGDLSQSLRARPVVGATAD
jgi:hypothetical protein